MAINGTGPARDDGAPVGQPRKGGCQMMASLAELKEEMNANQEEIMADIDVRAEACLKQLHEDIKGHMEALLEGLRFCGKWTTACQVSSVACPEKSKADPEEIKAEVVTFEERSDRIEAHGLEANPEATEAAVERQQLRKCFVVRHR
jgi:hypothetical protein